jgi:hypothetical protein
MSPVGEVEIMEEHKRSYKHIDTEEHARRRKPRVSSGSSN